MNPYCQIILQISTFAQTLSLNTHEATACNVFEASQSLKAASPSILVKLRTAVMTSGKAQRNEMYKNKAARWIRGRKKKKRVAKEAEKHK